MPDDFGLFLYPQVEFSSCVGDEDSLHQCFRNQLAAGALYTATATVAGQAQSCAGATAVYKPTDSGSDIFPRASLAQVIRWDGWSGLS